MPPTVSAITATFFLNLINRLGVRPPPPDAFLLSNVVQPVSIVDTDVSVSAISTTIVLDTPFTIGETVTPGAGTVLADTGALAAGNYAFLLLCGIDLNVATSIQFYLVRRNAANSADVWTQLFSLSNATASIFQFAFTAKLLLNERIRLITKQASTVTSAQASIFAQGPL